MWYTTCALFFFVPTIPANSICHPVSCTSETLPRTTQALDLTDLHPFLRRKCVRTLCRLCGRQALLPRSLQIPICYNRLEIPRYRGGYADVWMGLHQGLRVAVKVLRVYSTNDFGRVTKVRFVPIFELVH